MSATAVSAFSPPESRLTLCSFLPGGCAKISTPASPSPPSSWVSTRPARPPLKRRGKTCWNFSLTRSKVSRNRSRLARLILTMAALRSASEASRSAFCVGHEGVARGQLVVLLDGGEVDGPHPLGLGLELVEPLALRLAGRALEVEAEQLLACSSAWQRSRVCSSRWESSSACSRAVRAAVAEISARSPSTRAAQVAHLGVAGAAADLQPLVDAPGARRAGPAPGARARRRAGPGRPGSPRRGRAARRRGRSARRGRRRGGPGAPPPRGGRRRCAGAAPPIDSRRSESAATFTLRLSTSAVAWSARPRRPSSRARASRARSSSARPRPRRWPRPGGAPPPRGPGR